MKKKKGRVLRNSLHLFYIPGSIINNPFIIIRRLLLLLLLLLLSHKIFRRPFRLLYIRDTFYILQYYR